MQQYTKLDWKQSPGHVKCLALFVRPKSRQRVEEYKFLQNELKEGMEKAVQRFVDEGLLVTPPIEEIIDNLHNKGPIEEALRSQGLNSIGNKAKLIERLVKGAPSTALALVENHDILICSDEAQTFLTLYEERKKDAETETRRLVFTSLLKGDIKPAFEIFARFQEEFVRNDPHTPRYNADIIEILLTRDAALLEHLSSRDKLYLRAATCMPIFWYDENAVNWLPDSFATTFQSKDVICNLFRKFAEIQNSLKRAKETERRTFTFDNYDIDSCEVCRGLNGKTLQIRDIPELPDLNCVSKKGCQFHFNYLSDANDSDRDQANKHSSTSGDTEDLSTLLPKDEYEAFKAHIYELANEIVKVEVIHALDPINKLRIAKQMLDEALITYEEFNHIKQSLLNKLSS